MKNILLHGLGQKSSSWEDVIQVMSNKQDIICLDLSKLLYNIEPCYSNLYYAFERYCEQFKEPFNLCGLSLGGVLALNYAIMNSKKINSLVLIGTQVSMPKNIIKFQNIIFKLMPNLVFYKLGFNKSDFINLSKSMMNLDFSNDLKKINCPTLILCGEKDKINKPASILLKERIQNAEFSTIYNSGHEVNVCNPVELGKKLDKFFSNNKTDNL